MPKRIVDRTCYFTIFIWLSIKPIKNQLQVSWEVIECNSNSHY